MVCFANSIPCSIFQSELYCRPFAWCWTRNIYRKIYRKNSGIRKILITRLLYLYFTREKIPEYAYLIFKTYANGYQYCTKPCVRVPTRVLQVCFIDPCKSNCIKERLSCKELKFSRCPFYPSSPYLTDSPFVVLKDHYIVSQCYFRERLFGSVWEILLGWGGKTYIGLPTFWRRNNLWCATYRPSRIAYIVNVNLVKPFWGGEVLWERWRRRNSKYTRCAVEEWLVMRHLQTQPHCVSFYFLWDEGLPRGALLP